jgi:hypothetical protein
LIEGAEKSLLADTGESAASSQYVSDFIAGEEVTAIFFVEFPQITV